MSNFKHGDRGYKFKEIGLAIHFDYWGKGIAQDSVLKLINIDSEKKYLARVITNNTSSKKMFLKCGFRSAGVIDTMIFEPSNDTFFGIEYLIFGL